MIGRIRIAAFFLALAAIAPAWGQGFLLIHDHRLPHPRPPVPQPSPPQVSYRLKELAIEAKIVDQTSQVQVSQTFANTGSRTIEAQFTFPLPYDGAIDRLTFMVDGKEYEAKLLPAKDARAIYEGYVRNNRDPALLEWIGTGMFQTSVFPIPPGAERKVVLKYSQLLRRDRKLTDLIHPLASSKFTSAPLERLSFRATIEANEEIRSVYSATHNVDIKRPDAKHAIVSYEATNLVPETDFRLMYDTVGPGDGKTIAASVLSYRPTDSDEGYFLLLASPELPSEMKERLRKTVIFTLDRSGSMTGKKIEQAKEALKFALNTLREGDTFNIVPYDSQVESFRPELQKFDEPTRAAALAYVDGIYAGGSTNISEALTRSLGLVQDKNTPSFVIFLTDGLPTHGETNEAKIAAIAKAKNEHRVRLLNFGVGYNVNSRLLDRLARENFGQSQYVRPEEDIEAHVSRLAARMSSPVLTETTFAVDVEGAAGSAVSRVYPKDSIDLFAGDQLVVVGRYKHAGAAKITISGKLGSEAKKFDFPANLVAKSGDASYAFIEKLWAMRRVGEIIDQIDLHGKNEELVQELVGLSLKHGILTPYTSFLADDQARPGSLADAGENRRAASASLDQLQLAAGKAGVAQRAEKFSFQNAQNAAPAAAAPLARGREGGAAGPAPSGNSVRDLSSDRMKEVSGLRQKGNTALYQRGSLWIAANAHHLDPEKDAAKFQRVARFSKEYFDLTAANTAEENALLAMQQEGETLLVMLRNQAYRIE